MLLISLCFMYMFLKGPKFCADSVKHLANMDETLSLHHITLQCISWTKYQLFNLACYLHICLFIRMTSKR